MPRGCLRIPIINHLHVAFEQPSSFIRYSASVVAVSQYVADHSESLGAPKCVIHNISDLQRFASGVSLRRELGYTDSDVIVAFLGQMIRVKGLEMFIDLATRIVDPHARFIIAGALRNTQGAYTEDEIKEVVGRDPRIRYLGFRTDVENLYATSDVIRHAVAVGGALCDGSVRGCRGRKTGSGHRNRWHGGDPARWGNRVIWSSATTSKEMTARVARLIEDRALRNRLGEAASQLARRSLAVRARATTLKTSTLP